MEEELEEKIGRIREELVDIEGVNTAVIANADGKIIGSGVPFLAQISARLMDMAESVTADLDAEAPDEVIFGSRSEKMIVIKAGAKMLLAVRVKPEANEHLILLEMLRAAKEIEKLMKNEN